MVILRFNKANIDAIIPHRIVFANNGFNLLVLYYDEYHKNTNLFKIPKEKALHTTSYMKSYVIKYFYSMKSKSLSINNTMYSN